MLVKLLVNDRKIEIRKSSKKGYDSVGLWVDELKVIQANNSISCKRGFQNRIFGVSNHMELQLPCVITSEIAFETHLNQENRYDKVPW